MNEKLLEYKSLIDLIKTTDDLGNLDQEIELLLQSLYHTDVYKFDDVLSKYVRVRVAQEISRLMLVNSITGRDARKAFLTETYKTISTLPILRLTLAFEPSESMINNISYWARSNLEEGIIIDLTLDRNLLGGALIMHKGKFYDFSLKKRLEQVFASEDLTI